MTSFAQRSFAGGEIAPSLYARADQVKYATGLRTCRNFIVQRHGGVANRPGTRFVVEVKDSTKRVRLVRFVFNADQTYVLEFGNLYMRVIRNGARLTVSGVAAWSGATPYVVGDLAERLGVNYYCILAHTNQQPPNATYWYALTGAIYEIPTPYVEADLQALQYVQSGDVVTIVHPSYAVRDLSRTGHTAWTLTLATFAPEIAAPTGVTNSGTPGAGSSWVVTTIAQETFEESIASSPTQCTETPSAGTPITISWSAVTGAQEYNVFRAKNGVYGFIGVAGATSFADTGIVSDTTFTPPIARNPFSGTGNFPSTVTYFQQRKTFANTDNNPETIYASRSGNFKNFTISSPLQDDDAVTFTLAGREVNEILHLTELGKLVTFTSGGEWTIEGDADGVLRPATPNPRQQGYNGSSGLAPIVIGGNALYVQARGSIVRDLSYDFQIDGYRGNDLTIFAAHLFDSYTLGDWAYQQIPHSVVWAARSDGVLLGLTYVREHQIWGWHRHDTDGAVENVVVVPEGDEDAVYLVVRRTISGATRRYIERMESRLVSDVTVDAFFVDSGLSYDGRNTGSTTMTLSGGVNWDHTETLTLTASAGFFVAGDVGNAIVFTAADGTVVHLTITAYTSSTVVSVTPNKTVPAALRNVAQSSWSKAVDDLSGLDHLEGKTLSILADGNVEPQKTVSVGAITLTRPYSVIHAGLPYNSDLETLDIDSAQGAVVIDKRKLITRVTLTVESSRGIFAGPDAAHLREFKQRATENYGQAIGLLTGPVEINIESAWNSNGRIFVRQSDPLPLAVLAAVPSGLVAAG